MIRPNDSTELVFRSSIAGAGVNVGNDEVAWVGQPGALSMFLREGDPAPGNPGETVSAFRNLMINASGDVAVLGFASGLPGGQRIWAGPPGGLVRVAGDGDAAPGDPGLSIVSILSDVVLAPTGQIAFVATVADAGFTVFLRGIYATDLAGDLCKVALEGDDLQLFVGDVREISSLDMTAISTGSGGQDGAPHGFNLSSELLFNVFFTDGTAAVVRADVTSCSATPVPIGLPLVLAIALVATGSLRLRSLLTRGAYQRSRHAT